MPDLVALEWRLRWLSLAHPHQIEPGGEWWDTWLMLAGRGSGKTRASAETVAHWAWSMPETRWLVSAPTQDDLRTVCFEGDSGLLNVIPEQLIMRTATGGLWNSSLKELTLINGSTFRGISAEEPERFRGPQFHGGWLDELCSWKDAEEALEMIGYGMRLGKHPRLLISTTPKPTPMIRSMIKRNGKDVAITTASTYANEKNLAPKFLEKLKEKEGTRLGRQEIYAEVLDAEEGGIINRKQIKLWPADSPLPKFEYIVASFDTAFTDYDFDKKKQVADPTACTIWGVFHHEKRKRMCILLLDAWEDHMSFDDLRKKTLEESKAEWGVVENAYVNGKRVNKGRKPDLLVIEEKGSGISLAQSMEREGVPVSRYNPGRLNKVTRLHMVSHLFVNGIIYMPESRKNVGQPVNWADGLISQLCSFVGEGSTQHDDWVDSTTQALLILIQHLQITVATKEEKTLNDDDVEKPVDKIIANPYAS